MLLVIRSESVVTAQSLYGEAIREDVAFWKSSDPVPHVVTSGGETRTGAGVSGWEGTGQGWDTPASHRTEFIVRSLSIIHPTSGNASWPMAVGACIPFNHPDGGGRVRSSFLTHPPPLWGFPSGGINTRSHLDIRSLCRAFVAGIRSGCSQRIQRIRGRTFRFLFVRPSLL